MKFKHLFFTFVMACMAMGVRAADVYAVGAFNNWNIAQPITFDYADGLFTATIDFATGTQFKLSTSYPTGSDISTQWKNFDKGTYYAENPGLNIWTPLAAAATSPNIVAPTQQQLLVTVDLINLRIRFSGPDDPVKPYSGTLPVLFVNTEGGQAVTSKDTYLQATYWLDPMGVEGVEAIGSEEAPLVTQIKGRGNYSWVGFDKKPYRLKLDKKQPLLGMPSSKHWALLAHADDNLGMLRNVAGFAASTLLGMPWTPGAQPVELVLNGNYRGLYFLTETIRVDKTRVNITEQADEATTDVDGGWLVEIDNYNTDPHVTVYENGNRNAPIWFTYNSPEVLSTQQSDYLTTAMTNIDNAIYKNGTDAAALEALVDFDVLARYYIVQEIMDDTESFHGSCFLNRNRGAECKWLFGPVWDFGNAFHRTNYQQFIWQNPSFSQVWIGGIYKYEAFVAAVKKVWADFLNSGPADLDNEVKAMAERIAVAADYDYARWPSYGTNNEMGKYTAISQKINNKIDWLKQQWGAEPSAVADITVDADADAPVVYYDLMGKRIANPRPGQLIIRRQGNAATKIVVR